MVARTFKIRQINIPLSWFYKKNATWITVKYQNIVGLSNGFMEHKCKIWMIKI